MVWVKMTTSLRLGDLCHNGKHLVMLWNDRGHALKKKNEMLTVSWKLETNSGLPLKCNLLLTHPTTINSL